MTMIGGKLFMVRKDGAGMMCSLTSRSLRTFKQLVTNGYGGPLTVSKASYVTPLSRAFVEAGKEFGLEEIDYNGALLSLTQQTIKRGVRWSTAKAFLHPVRYRSNLFVWTGKSVV